MSATAPNASNELPGPQELATDAIGELDKAVGELNAVLTLLENGGNAEPGTVQSSGSRS